MFLKLQVLLLFMSISFPVKAEKILPLKTIKVIEQGLEKQIKERKLTKERRYYLYLLAGRELLNYRYLDKSEEYYKKALALNLSVNRTEIFINLISIAIRREDEKEIKVRINSALKYFDSNKAYLNSDLQTYLSFLKRNYLNSGSKSDKIVVDKSFYGHYTKLQEIPKKIKKKKYLNAYADFNPKGLENADIGLKITYDVLNVLVNKRKVKNLLCDPLFRKYPNSYSYSMKICKILKSYISTGRIPQKLISNLEKYFNDTHRDKKYLLSAIKDLEK